MKNFFISLSLLFVSASNVFGIDTWPFAWHPFQSEAEYESSDDSDQWTGMLDSPAYEVFLGATILGLCTYLIYPCICKQKNQLEVVGSKPIEL
jgi:hypothetical protein